jgi:hypothetical protein
MPTFKPLKAGCSGLGRLLEMCKRPAGRARIYGGKKGISTVGRRLETCKRKKF